MSDAAAQLATDLAGLAADLADLSAADAAAAALLAQQGRRDAPRRTGYMASTINHAGPLVTVAAPYAPFVHARYPFLALAAEQVDWAAPHTEAVSDALAALEGTYR